MTIDQLNKSILEWANKRGILNFVTSEKQMIKVLEEVGELAAALLRKDREAVIDAIGDTFITLTILAELLDIDIKFAILSSYNIISSRQGSIVDGTFIKQSDFQ